MMVALLGVVQHAIAEGQVKPTSVEQLQGSGDACVSTCGIAAAHLLRQRVFPPDHVACIDHLPEEAWEQVAAKLTTDRGALECRLRWFSALHPGVQQVEWDDALDDRLLTLVQEHQERNVR